MDPVPYLGPEERWKLLGISIVKQAIVDWKEASLKLKNVETASREMNELKNSAEHFLTSNMCEFYSGCDGKTLVRKMKAGLI